MPEIRSASDTKVVVSEFITAHLRVFESLTRMIFRFMNLLAVPGLLGPTFTDKFIKSLQPAERKIVICPSPTVPILMVHEANREPKKNT